MRYQKQKMSQTDIEQSDISCYNKKEHGGGIAKKQFHMGVIAFGVCNCALSAKTIHNSKRKEDFTSAGCGNFDEKEQYHHISGTRTIR